MGEILKRGRSNERYRGVLDDAVQLKGTGGSNFSATVDSAIASLWLLFIFW